MPIVAASIPAVFLNNFPSGSIIQGDQAYPLSFEEVCVMYVQIANLWPADVPTVIQGSLNQGLN